MKPSGVQMPDIVVSTFVIYMYVLTSCIVSILNIVELLLLSVLVQATLKRPIFVEVPDQVAIGKISPFMQRFYS